jgi:hydroxymethylbilane synthase
MVLAQTEDIARRLSIAAPDPTARLSYDAEREVLWVLNGHCSQLIEVTRSGPANRPRKLGRAFGLALLNRGASDIIARTRPEP